MILEKLIFFYFNKMIENGWGSINYPSIWGVSPIYVTESYKYIKHIDFDVNKEYHYLVESTYYINGELHSQDFAYNKKIPLGQYLLQTLPHYVLKNGALVLETEPLFLDNVFNYYDLSLMAVKSLHFGSITHAEIFINVFGVEPLFINKIIKKVSETDFVNFWNLKIIISPLIRYTLINYCITNFYHCKKKLDYITWNNFAEPVKNVEVPYHENYDIQYLYCEPDNYNPKIILTKNKPENYVFNFKCLGEENEHLIKNHIGFYVDINSRVVTLEKSNIYIVIKPTELLLNTYVCVVNGKLDYEPVPYNNIVQWSVKGFRYKVLKLIYTNKSFVCDLYILLSRIELFKHIIPHGNVINDIIEIHIEDDIKNLLCFVFTSEADITNVEYELFIGIKYQVINYVNYIKNHLIKNNLALYYSIYHNI